MGDIGQVYAEGRERITSLVSGVTPEQAETPVPTCPEWTVHDVVAHLAGVCTDVLEGRLEGVATDPWTAVQVAARRDRPVEELLAEWATAAPQVEAMAQFFPGRVGTQWVLDQVTHEHDLRCALGAPGARDSEGVAMGFEFLVGGLGVSVAGHGLPPLEVRADGVSWVVGGDGCTDIEAVLMGADPPLNLPGVEAAATLEASRFELLRALTGRRSLDQVRRYSWTGEAEVYLPAFKFGPFSPAATDITE